MRRTVSCSAAALEDLVNLTDAIAERAANSARMSAASNVVPFDSAAAPEDLRLRDGRQHHHVSVSCPGFRSAESDHVVSGEVALGTDGARDATASIGSCNRVTDLRCEICHNNQTKVNGCVCRTEDEAVCDASNRPKAVQSDSILPFDFCDASSRRQLLQVDSIHPTAPPHWRTWST